MHDRYALLVKQLAEAVLAGPGVMEPMVRQAIEGAAAAYGGRFGTPATELPPALRAYVEKVARYAYKVTDQDIQALQKMGYSDDTIFEATISAALGAGMGRLERGLASLRGEE